MRQKLGQHFLINKSAIRKIIATLELKKGETIVEIGPGEGALTLPLAEECQKIGCKLIAIEKDPFLVSRIMNHESLKNMEIIKGDALKELSSLCSKFHDSSFKIVGNIPYYITGKLLRILGEMENKPELIVLTVQKEVAQRLAAKPPKMNLLAASVQVWAEPEIIGYLKPSDFSPAPEVDSAIIKLKVKQNELKNGDSERYYRLIRAVFKQPRKTVLNNLSTGLKAPKSEILEKLKKFGLNGAERPQNLSLSQLSELSQELE